MFELWRLLPCHLPLRFTSHLLPSTGSAVVNEILRRRRPEFTHVRGMHGREGPVEMLVSIQCRTSNAIAGFWKRDLQPAVTNDARLFDQFDRLGERAGVVLVGEW